MGPGPNEPRLERERDRERERARESPARPTPSITGRPWAAVSVPLGWRRAGGSTRDACDQLTRDAGPLPEPSTGRAPLNVTAPLGGNKMALRWTEVECVFSFFFFLLLLLLLPLLTSNHVVFVVCHDTLTSPALNGSEG